MQITIDTASYNHRRHGRPWIATVDFSETAKGEFAFGEWAGDSYNGGEGILSIDAEPGQIIAEGQKDNRQPRNSAPKFYAVRLDGSLETLGDKGEAYKWYLAQKKNTPDREQLIAEREALQARLAEIETLLAG